MGSQIRLLIMVDHACVMGPLCNANHHGHTQGKTMPSNMHTWLMEQVTDPYAEGLAMLAAD